MQILQRLFRAAVNQTHPLLWVLVVLKLNLLNHYVVGFSLSWFLKTQKL